MTSITTFATAFSIRIASLQPVSKPSTGNRTPQPTKVAQAQLIFVGGPLDGLRLRGFTISRRPDGTHFMTPPDRAYTKHGKHESYELLIADSTRARDTLEAEIVAAYLRFQADRTEREYPPTDLDDDDGPPRK